MITAFPLVQDKINLTTGTITITGNRLAHCEVDGTLTLNFKDGSTPLAYEMRAGEDRLLPTSIVSVTITLGTFSFA